MIKQINKKKIIVRVSNYINVILLELYIEVHMIMCTSFIDQHNAG
jgi:hypothetical protein